MLCINNLYTNPYFNIASEEYLLKNSNEDFFMLYRNSPSLIIGKHQNTLAEINFNFVKQNEITIVRRLSGGGTVYHDEGNINFTFIGNTEQGKSVDFKKHLVPIVEFLKTIGLNAEIGSRNEILLAQKKISGNAEHVYKNRVLHHGTLLFNSNLQCLEESIMIDLTKFSDKAVKSVKSSVTNICNYLNEIISVETFQNKLFSFVLNQFQNTVSYIFTEKDTLAINQLINEKYSTWQWNFGYSPKYFFSKETQLNEGFVKTTFDVRDGMIETIHIESDFLSKEVIEILTQTLQSVKHSEKEIVEKIKELNSPLIKSIENKLINLFF